MGRGAEIHKNGCAATQTTRKNLPASRTKLAQGRNNTVQGNPSLRSCVPLALTIARCPHRFTAKSWPSFMRRTFNTRPNAPVTGTLGDHACVGSRFRHLHIAPEAPLEENTSNAIIRHHHPSSVIHHESSVINHQSSITPPSALGSLTHPSRRDPAILRWTARSPARPIEFKGSSWPTVPARMLREGLPPPWKPITEDDAVALPPLAEDDIVGVRGSPELDM